MLEGGAPADEAALVTSQYLRGESELLDIVDGQIVAVDPDCVGVAPTAITAPANELGEIVTSTEPPLTPEEIFAEFSPDEIAQIGGEDCARELVEIFAASAAYSNERGTDPETLDNLLDGLDAGISRQIYEDHEGTIWLVATGGIGRLVNDRFQTVLSDEQLPIGNLTALA